MSKNVIEGIIKREGALTKEGIKIDIKNGDVKAQLIAVLKKKGPRFAVQVPAGLIPGGTIASAVVRAIASAV